MFNIFVFDKTYSGGYMRVSKLTLQQVKQEIVGLKGKKIEMEVNRGRRKIETYNGVIKDIYPSVFTVEVIENSIDNITYSYSDVLCGDVKIKQVN